MKTDSKIGDGEKEAPLFFSLVRSRGEKTCSPFLSLLFFIFMFNASLTLLTAYSF